MSVFVEDHEFPHRYRPFSLDIQGQVVLDQKTFATGFQLRPDLVQEFLAWSGGTLLDDMSVQLPSGPVVSLGDYALHSGSRWTMERADGFHQRWWPEGKTQR